MKRIGYILLILIGTVVFTTSCNKEGVVNVETPIKTVMESIEPAVTESVAAITDTFEYTGEIQTTEESITVNNTDSHINTPSPTHTSSTESETVTTGITSTTKSSTVKPSATKSVTTVKPTTPKPTTAKPTQTIKPTTVTQTVPNEWDAVAKAENAEKVADRLIYYINKYRQEEGQTVAIKLQGLTKVAVYRSKQLVTKFEHNTTLEREAATYYKYGQYIDPSLYGSSGEPYYQANAREAISKFQNYSGVSTETIDYIAKSMIDSLRKSSGHWSYVGVSKYPYIAVGMTCDKGSWYACILMSQTNEYE